MLVTEALCRKTGKSLKQLVAESSRAVCLSKNFMPKKKKQKTATGAVSGEKKVQDAPAQSTPAKVKNNSKTTHGDKKPVNKNRNRKRTKKANTDKQ
jgi:hypothetical protein